MDHPEKSFLTLANSLQVRDVPRRDGSLYRRGAPGDEASQDRRHHQASRWKAYVPALLGTYAVPKSTKQTRKVGPFGICLVLYAMSGDHSRRFNKTRREHLEKSHAEGRKAENILRTIFSFQSDEKKVSPGGSPPWAYSAEKVDPSDKVSFRDLVNFIEPMMKVKQIHL